MIDHDRFQGLIKTLYSTVEQLEVMFPGRHFTPDGHMVGSIGECLVADAYGLELMPASNQGFDAVAPDGTKVEIKATQSNSVAFRSAPERPRVSDRRGYRRVPRERQRRASRHERRRKTGCRRR